MDLILLGGAIALYLFVICLLVAAGRGQDARAVAGFIPDCVVLLRRLLADGGMPRSRRLAILLLIAYLALPIDLVPDFIPAVGQLDDAILVVLVLRFVLRAAGREALGRHWPGPPEGARLIGKLAFG
jgi:uncharacterized membrane protein YkvA (DUF1232 family)